MTPAPVTRIVVILGNQLFEPRHLGSPVGTVVFMAEAFELCTDVAHHQQKIVLFLAAMRHYADELRAAGFTVCYRMLQEDGRDAYEERLAAACGMFRCTHLEHFEIEDRPMETRLQAFAIAHAMTRRELPSPMFLCSRADFAAFVAQAPRPLMADFYRWQRERLDLLLEPDGSPTGGRWSFDTENRRKLPRRLDPPPLTWVNASSHVKAVQALVAEHFATHPGQAGDFAWPVTRDGARTWLAQFIDERLPAFGPFEDALTQRSDALFHGVLTPFLNLGLLTPDEVIDAALTGATREPVPIASLEGFIRQVAGWREYMRGLYRAHGPRMERGNFFDHHRRPGPSWRDGTTGIVPLDAAIRRALRLGWTHHIERLMVAGNLMTLCEIEPAAAWRWFMELFIDSAEWVMHPNVYGMALHADGGAFFTKPYVCGSNYLLKMSDYAPGPWCDIVDGLYWRFVAKHRAYLASNARLSEVPRALDRIPAARRAQLLGAAEHFLAAHTIAD